MNAQDFSKWGIAGSRIALGLIALAHGPYLKGFVYTLPGTAQFFASVGLPAGLGYVVFGIEAVAGTLLVLGWQVRLAALALLPVMLGATWVHAQSGWVFSSPGGGWEYPALLAVLTVVQAALGAGALVLRLGKDRAPSVADALAVRS